MWHQKNESYRQNIKPFLRWVGGKNRLVKFLIEFMPSNFSTDNTYYEPFLGAGNLFFRKQPKNAILSDRNKELIESYQAIQKHPELVYKYLNQHLSKTCKEYYYEKRNEYNNSKSSIKKAALFIYLNKTSFNGIWRVNTKGEFNVPYGYKEPPSLPSKNDLFNISKSLENTILIHKDYKESVNEADFGDFIYFDPPYPPLNGTSYFTHYTKDRFTKEDHSELASIAKMLDERGCLIMISNADIPFIRSLYDDSFYIHELKVTRWIRTDGKRYKVGEVIITNYKI